MHLERSESWPTPSAPSTRRGRSNQGISRILWLSPKTVETHIRGAFTKLGLAEAPEDNRRVLAVLAYLER
jgi:DNA-binding NarL/FixJ family response regulator